MPTRSACLLALLVLLIANQPVFGQTDSGNADEENPMKISIPGEFSGKIDPVGVVWTEFTVPKEGLESLFAALKVEEGNDPALTLYNENREEMTSSDFFGTDVSEEYLTSLFLAPGKYFLALRAKGEEGSGAKSWNLKVSGIPPVKDEDVHRALNKALDYLVAKQKENGDMGDGFWSAGLNGLALQALLGAEGIKRDDWKTIFKGIDFLKNYYHDPASIQDPRQKLLYSGGIFEDPDHGNYEHAIALTALIEAQALGVEANLEPIIRNALDFLLRGQLTEDRPKELEGPFAPDNIHYGGWRYFLTDQTSDLSVTAWQIIALISAKKAGLPVPPERFEKALVFIKNCYWPEDKRFAYLAGTNDTTVGRCGMAALSMKLMGAPEGPEYQDAFKEMFRKAPSWEGEPGGTYPFYYWYYGTRAAYLAGGDIWRVWRQNICGILVRHQEADGSWRLNHSEERSGKTYIAALGALMLEIGAGCTPFYLRTDKAPKRAPPRPVNEITVCIVSPANGTIVKGMTTIVANPTVPQGGKVKKVVFFVEDKQVGEAVSAPWECGFDFGEEAKAHSIRVEAENDQGKKASATVRSKDLVNDVRVKIHRPLAKMVSGSEEIIVEAAGHPESPLKTVTVTVDGEEIYSGEEAPGSLSFEFGAGKSHTIIARAVNSLGREASDTVRTFEPPNEISVSIQEPSPDSLLSGTNRVLAHPLVPEGNIVTRVTFFVDGKEIAVQSQEPWETEFDFGEAVISHVIKVVAENAQGKQASAEVTTRQPQSNIEVHIRRPREEIVTGELDIEAEAFSNPESPLKSVTIEVDGKEVFTGTEEPFSVKFDFGQEATVHEIVAKAVNSAGKTAEDRVKTTEPPPLEVDLTAIVTDAKNVHVLDRKMEDFQILENGKAQKIVRFKREAVPVSIALILDTSGSMKKSMGDMQKAATQFLSQLQSQDSLVLMEFSDDVNILQDFTSDVGILSDAVKRTKATRGTALYDAVIAGCRKLKERQGKAAIILLSDGKDEDNAGTKPGSKQTSEQAIQVAKETGAIIYPLGLGKKISKEFLESLALESGGRAYFPPSAKDLAQIYSQIAKELRSQYSLGYSSTNRVRDGKWRSLEISVPGTDLNVRTRKGFFAR